MKTEVEQCPECKAYRGHHSPKCSLIDLEEAKKQLLQYYDLWLTRETKQRAKSESYNKWAKLLRADCERWRGKFLIVTHENNKLRNKLNKKND